MNSLKSFMFAFSLIWLAQTISSQEYYFPPVFGNSWETLDPAELGWCSDKIPSFYEYLDSTNTKAFIVLKDGKIVLEKYFGTFTQDSSWYWASAGKTLTAFMVGVAQDDNFLSINDKTSKYLGTGWTSLPSEKEDLITIRNQLSMTTGLDEGVPNSFCTLPVCLQYKSDAGARWSYHNGPYTLLDEVIKNATSQNLNQYISSKLLTKTGISGIFLKLDYNNVFFSKPRSMARFGSLILNKGNWNNQVILQDKNYFESMVSTSQNINLSYGYLWWLNGKESSMLPSSQIVFPRQLFLHAPSDMYSAMGKNGQIINIVPSQNIVMIRMGNVSGNDLISVAYNDNIWKLFNEIQCTSSSKESLIFKSEDYPYPNPSSNFISINHNYNHARLSILDINGKIVKNIERYLPNEKINIENHKNGMYVIKLYKDSKCFHTSSICKIE